MDQPKNLQQRTKKYSLDIIKVFQSLPKTTEAQILGKQLLRSGTSVGANTRSAFRGRSGKEFRAKLSIVVEEADEAIFWLELIKESGILVCDDLENLIEESDALVSIFISIIKKNAES
ncbi:hypothetical protein C900_03117 [Fulvivirga imtechensis AK7]|uniref:Four helix bundle protein n=1 Tax=Fulvivirga imtechensis AK7 TaxID=1237149 RepID=L8JUL8_9BACT|nr:four helix bundle protein [Fulvivirga imtechensis]ELR70987.1 hypothetical protein C900_03117 [Fulvivirga imtechensis AK7]